MFYDRKIKYFDYREHGERVRNGGFVKLEARDNTCILTIHISDLHNIGGNSYQVFIISGERREKLCEIQLQQGSGSKMLELNCDDICAGIPYLQIDSLLIPITSTRELYCSIGKQDSSVMSSDKSEIKSTEEAPCEELQYEESQCEEFQCDKIQCEELHKEERNNDEIHVEERVQEDKWKQLSVIYPHIAPFQDDREYLSIGPGDFVILSRQYYPLVNNSFLLHGFYNYRHLILTRMEKRGELLFYVGVPGNFYEREKQVALMFGFESFECREEPAEVGDFGYYMIRVEL